MADLMNKRLGGFRILAEIKGASGSQGQVYKACCEEPPFEGIEVGSVVALKVMPVHDEDGKAWARLLKRTEELVRLSHPNVVKYYGCFSESGPFNDIHVIVQEFLDGETLKQRLEKCPLGLDADEALKVTKAALSGLEYMAENGIVHRDVKPGNIFLCSDGGVKFIDFEIAHKEGGTTTASSNNLIGSFDYMAPDFTDAEFRGDVQSDVFSMGVVMHEAITGRTPYKSIEEDNSQANFAFLQRWARLHVDGTSPIQISSRANQLLAHSGTVLAKALAPLSKDRYANFTEFRKGLAAVRYRDLKGRDDVYRILQRVGKGGFGEVFKARSKNTGKFVAIKHLLKAAYAERFYREAKIMAQLRDPCFVNFIGFFVIEHSGSEEAFLVMDFLPGMPGSSLRDAIKRRKGRGLRKREVLLSFARFAHGLAVMHDQGIFHRDIKPSNLYYPEGHPERAAIMDLGIARNIHGTATTGQVPGTLDYMPPEVVLSDNRGDSRMDIYALGLCLYEALTGKMAFPRLPQGTAAYTEFLNRARNKTKPDISDSTVSSDEALYELVRQMTDPEVSARLSKAADIENTLRKLAEKVPTTESDDDYDDGPETGETVIVSDDLEKERKRFLARRRMRRLAASAAVVAALAACAGLWFVFRGSVVGWLQRRAASEARPEAERVAATYGNQGLEAGGRAEDEWLSRWAPGHGGRWVELDEESFALCTNSICAAKLKLQDVAAEGAAVDVESVYKANGVKAGEEKFASWRAEWKPKCSSAKFDELEKRIHAARERRMKHDIRSSWQKFRDAGQQVALRYLRSDVSLEDCDGRAKKWRELRPGDFPEGEFAKLEASVRDARAERIREDDKNAAESALETVLKSYADGTAAGDGKAEDWRKAWKEKLSSDDLSRMESQIAAAKAERAEIERRQRIKEKKKKCGDELKPITAGYRDDSSNKAGMDADYGKWNKKWKSDRDLPVDWLNQLMSEVEKEKQAREARIRKAEEIVRKAANDALQSVVRAYDDSRELAVCNEQAEAWRKKWERKLDAGAYSRMNAQIASVREKRVNHDRWVETQRILAAKTNEVETVRAVLADAYGKLDASAGDADKKKADIDSRFSKWAKEWDADAALQESLPNWFGKRKQSVGEAKAACEARIDEARRIAFVAAKTNEVASVRTQLMDGYRSEAADKAGLDRKFTEWMLKWSADADLPPGWFAEQRQPVEKEKKAREQRQKAREAAEATCEIYRLGGVTPGDAKRDAWKGDWSNRLEKAIFLELCGKIDKARERRVEVEAEQQAREESRSVCDGYRSGGLTVGDKHRDEWRSRWNGKFAASSFRELSQTIDKVRAEVAKDQEGILASKTNDVVSVCAALVQDYGNDSVKMSEIDSRFAKWAKDWESDEILRNSLPNWFDERRKTVETARGSRENRIKQRMAQIETGRKGLEDGYRDDSSDKAKLDEKFDKWSEHWKKDVDLAPDWLAEQMDAVSKERSAREKREEDRERARQQANLVCDSYRKYGVAAGDGSRAMWINTWTNELVATEFNKLSGQIDEARADAAKAVVPEPPKPKPVMVDMKLVAAKKKEAEAMRKQLVDGYKADTSNKAKLDKEFAEWTAKWKADSDLPSGWFAEQMIAVEREKMAREVRDERATQLKARIAAKTNEVASVRADLVRDFANDSTEKSKVDARFDEWIRKWEYDADLQQALPNWFAEQKGAVVAAKDAREERVRRKRISAKTNEVESVRLVLVRDYGNDSVRKSEVDSKFNEWVRKWEYDADLQQALPNWFAAQKRTVDAARDAREERVRKRVASKKKEAEAMRKQLVDGYKADTSNKAELDKKFAEWTAKWKADSDLPPGWFAEQRLPVEREKMAREVRDASNVTPNPNGNQPAALATDDWIRDKLAQVELSIESNDGDLCLQIYMDLKQNGYNLTDEDKENVKQAFEICQEDYPKKLKRAKEDVHFSEKQVRDWWKKVMSLYFNLTGSRATEKGRGAP